ncbi:nucleoside-triphosphatase [Dielma fastidiosa]|uniref:nucleoside-triphosphatase n=1 Tax=Dielma fastidiosa TaxID=1034346 RepID=UPI0023F4ADAF|nr:nucleoside-triphosphatase [Dielma fastidiosa]
MSKHLFLTGEKKVGKSSAIKKFLSIALPDFSGYQTQPVMINERIRGYALHSFEALDEEENDVIISVRAGVRRNICVEGIFDTIGVKIIQAAVAADAELVIIDELGKLEDNAPDFQAAIKQLLDSNHRVLGVLQKKESKMSALLNERDDCEIIEISEADRDMAVDKISQWYRG